MHLELVYADNTFCSKFSNNQALYRDPMPLIEYSQSDVWKKAFRGLYNNFASQPFNYDLTWSWLYRLLRLSSIT